MFAGKLTKREETYIYKSRNEKGVVLLVSVTLTHKLEWSERWDLNREISSIGFSFKAFFLISDWQRRAQSIAVDVMPELRKKTPDSQNNPKQKG